MSRAMLPLAILFLAVGLIGIAPAQEQEGSPATGNPADDLYWLTEAERAWLADHNVIRNGVMANHEPFEFVDQSGTLIGLTSDYLQSISERLGVRLEPVVLDSFSELAEAMQAGEIDVSSYLPMSVEWAEVLPFSDPVISMPIAVFGRQNSDLVLSLSSLSEWRVAIERPSRASELLSRDWPELDFIYVDSPEDGLLALAENDADYFIHNIFSVEYYQRKLALEPVKIALMTPYSFDIRFATSPELEPLVPILHKAIASMGDHERALIFDKWVNVQADQSFPWKTFAVWGGGFAFFVFAAMCSVLFWNRRLAHEVTARTQDLESSKEALRALAAHIDRVREEEKSRLAREIHDELGHTLTALAMRVRRIANSEKKKRANGSGASAISAKSLDELRGLVKDATQTSRRIMSDLRPSVLEDLGLVAAIEWLAHEFESNYEVSCEVIAEDLAIELGDGVGIALFRIVQESLTNIAKHAAASKARIELVVAGGSLTLAIRDNGKGAAPQPDASSEQSFGLLGMSERALALGGSFRVLQENESGTCIRVRIPV